MQATPYPEVALAEDRGATGTAGIALACALGVAVFAALWFGGQGSLLRAAIPAMAALIALVLYLTRPILFVQYSLWVWFLAPLVRRIVDWRFGFVEPNLVLLAPFLVSAVAALSLLPSRSSASVRPPLPFVLCGAGIAYGFVVGMLVHPSAETAFGLLNWLCPLLFGFYLYVNWPRYEQYRDAICRTFVWGVLLLGIYGVYQFFFPPQWDRYWLENVMSTSASFGRPEALQIRVWSTSNSPGPFANIMMAGLLLLMVRRTPLKLPAAIAGYLSFLLSVVRTAWLSWFLGFVWLLKSTNPRVITRVVLSIVLLVACLLPLMSDPRIAPLVEDRFASFSDLGHDDSFGARLDMYRLLVHDAINNPFGNGLKNLEVSHGVGVDSGIFALVFSLGWLGGGLYMVGVAFLFLGRAAQQHKKDEFLAAGKAINIGILAQIIGGSIFAGLTGALFWVFAGIYFGGIQYHGSQAHFAGEQALDELLSERVS